MNGTDRMSSINEKVLQKRSILKYDKKEKIQRNKNR